MFRFPSLKNIIRDIACKVDAALKMPATADKVENLLAARDQSEESMKKLERKQGDIGFAAFLGTFVGGGLLLAGIVTAAPGALLATPLFLAGAAITALTAGTGIVLGQSLDVLRADRDAITKQINREVQNIATAEPKEADKSPRFLGSLYSVFKLAAAEGDKTYENLVAAVTPKKTVTAKIEAPSV